MKAILRIFAMMTAATAVALAGAGCTSGESAAGPGAAPPVHPYIADADAQGYLVVDPAARTVRGVTRSGATNWTESDVDPLEIRCVGACPNAVISTRGTDTGVAGTVRWIPANDRSTAADLAGVTRVLWAASPESWIGSTGDRLVLRSAAKKDVIALGNVTSAVVRISPDRRSAMVSTPSGDGSRGFWEALAVTIEGDRIAPGARIGELPGPVGCWGPGGNEVFTIGKSPTAVSVESPARRRPLPLEFSSDCSSSDSWTAVTNFKSGPNGAVANVSVISGSDLSVRSSSSDMTSATGFRPVSSCLALAHSGRLSFLNPGSGRTKASETAAVDVWAIDSDSAYVLSKEGSAKSVQVRPDDCP